MDGKEGLVDTLGERFDLNILTDGLGKSFRITRCSMKAFPTEALTHSPISAVIKVMKANGLSRNDVETVTIRTFRKHLARFSTNMVLILCCKAMIIPTDEPEKFMVVSRSQMMRRGPCMWYPLAGRKSIKAIRVMKDL